jgi:hypothetical protein
LDAFETDYVVARSCQVALFVLACSACGASTPRPGTPKTIVVEPDEKPAAGESEPRGSGSPPEPERKLAATACTPGGDAVLEPAKKLFQEGVQMYERGEYGAAIAAFKESYELTCKAALLHNIARAEEQLGDVEGAILTYERLIQTVEPSDPLLDVAKRRVEELRKRQ